MTTDKPCILVVDDIEDNIALLELILDDDYQVTSANNGTTAITLATEQQPDLILLDINMPDIDGYEVCKQLKQQPETAMIPVIFVSALDLPEQQLEGYTVGGEGYIVKPIDSDKLQAQLSKTLGKRLEQKALQQQASDAVKTAMEAMTTSSELGALIQFMKNNVNCNTVDELAAATRSVASNFGLLCCMKITQGGKDYYFDCKQDSVEARVLTQCSQAHRIFDFGQRSVFSENNVSILIKNMPLDDPSRYGRLKDHLCVLCNIADSRVDSMDMAMTLESKRTELLDQLIAMSERELTSTRQKAHDHDQQIRQIMQDMIQRLEEKLLFLGLDDDQESTLIKLASETSQRLENIRSFSEEVEDSLGQLLEGLYKLLG